MAVRPNPYVGSGSVYSSRGLTPSSIMANGSSAIALPLAQMVGGIIESANYDPTTDINAMNAKKIAEDLRRQKDRDIVLRQQQSVVNDPTVSLGDMVGQLVNYGSVGPEDAAKYGQLFAAQRGPAEGQSMDDFLTSTDPYQAAARGSNATFTASTFPTRKKPTVVMQDGQPQYVAAEDAVGMAPVLNESEQKGRLLGDLAASMSRPEQMRVVGAEPLSETVMNYIGPDGQRGSGPASQIPTGPGFTAFTGQAQGTPEQLRPPVQSGIQENELELAAFGQTLGTLRDLSGDPTNFGLPGIVKDAATQGMSLVKGFAQLTGRDYTKEIEAIASTPIDDGSGKAIKLDVTRFDPRIHGLKAFAELAAYQAASALAKQSGRSVALPEIEAFRNIVGIPLSPMMSQEKFLSGIDMLEQEVQRRSALNRNVMRNGFGTGSPVPAPGGQGAPPPRRIRIDAQGNIIQ